jgi:hypothetical protein
MDLNFTLAGKTKVIPPSAVSSTRYSFMSLGETEPNLGLPSGTGVYYLTSDQGGGRGWTNREIFDYIDAIEIRTNRLHALSAHIDQLTALSAKIDYLDVDYTTGFTVGGDLTVTENITANNAFFDVIEANHIKAITKSFLVNHPTKKDKKLHYGSLESPYHGIRLTGKGIVTNGICVVELPEYISNFVLEEDINIQITNYQHNKTLYVHSIDIGENKFIVKLDGMLNKFSNYDFFWSFTAVRKDVEKLQVEE